MEWFAGKGRKRETVFDGFWRLTVSRVPQRNGWTDWVMGTRKKEKAPGARELFGER